MGFLVVGVTGGTGSGKSTVSRFLAQLGAEVIDADAVSRELTSRGGRLLDEMVKHFGSGILNGDGSLDRKFLGEMVFKDREKLLLLNEISHGSIAEEIISRVNTAKHEKKHGVIVVDAPIPIEHGFLDVVNEVWVVVSDMDTRLRRIMNRNGFSKEHALKIISSQMSQEDYLKLADEVIFNDADLMTLKEVVSGLYARKYGSLA